MSNVVIMEGMFTLAINFNQDLSRWDVVNVNNCADFDHISNSWILPKPNFTNCST